MFNNTVKWFISHPLAEHCQREAGLSLDVIVNPDGDYIFLEVNESGQFLWIEHYIDLPLLDAFSEFLIQGTVNFDWGVSDRMIRCVDVEGDAKRNRALAAMQHVKAPPKHIASI